MGVIIASTQLRSSSSSLSDIGAQANAGTETAVQTSTALACEAAGGSCVNLTDNSGNTLICADTDFGASDCATGLNCCEKGITEVETTV